MKVSHVPGTIQAVALLRSFSFLKSFPTKEVLGFPWWLSGKEPICRGRRCGFDPWVRKIPWRRKWQPTPVFLPGESHGQRSLAATVYGVTEESDMT